MNFKVFSIAILVFTTISCRKTIQEVEDIKLTGSNLTIVNDYLNGEPIVVAGSGGLDLLVSFGRQLDDGTILEFVISDNNLPVLFTDQELNDWDIFGVCTSGPRLGEHLPVINASMGYYFAFEAFYPGVDIYLGSNVSAPPNSSGNDEWLIDQENVFIAAGFNAIKSVDDPHFLIYRERDFFTSPFYVSDDNRVLVVKVGEEVRAYPHNILNWHEIVNDQIADVNIAVNFCPLTGTGYCWDRGNSTFGVSGMLYNNNLIMYDRNTQSLWSQIIGKSVFGQHIETYVPKISVFETSFQTAKAMFGTLKIMTEETGQNLNYLENPYEQYLAAQDFLLFPTTYKDDRLPTKKRVFGVEIDGKCRVYQLEDF